MAHRLMKTGEVMPLWSVVKTIKLLLMFFLCLQAHSPAFAGSQQHSGEGKFNTEQVAAFAKKVEKFAGSKGARAFIIARQGMPQSELPEQVQFTHVGLAIYSQIATADGRKLYGYAIHNLYQKPDDLDHSHLIMDYPIDFFVGAESLKAGIIIPTPALQQKLIATIESGGNQRLHNANYSIVSNPYSQKFQNCTEHLLDIVFAAIYQTENIQQIKVNEQAYFNGQAIRLSPIKRLLAPMIGSGVDLSDHPGQIKTVTFTSMARFLTSQGLADGFTLIDESGPNTIY